MTAFSALALLPGGQAADFDRLDGTGESRKRVDVVEWAGNLEIHVYPQGSLAGLGLKLDKRDENKPVMVIAYRFTDRPKKTLIRRNILTIPLKEEFHVYRDPNADGYDKVVISNHRLSGRLAGFELDPPPEHLYPEEHPKRQIASQDKSEADPARERPSPTPQGTTGILDEHGRIQPFSW